MRILFLLLILTVFVKAQYVFVDSFPTFPPDTINTGMFCTIQDSAYITPLGGSELTDWIGTYTLINSGFSAGFDDETTPGSIISQGGYHIQYGSPKYLSNGSTDFNLGTSDFTLQIWFFTPSSLPAAGMLINDWFNQISNSGWSADIVNTNHNVRISNQFGGIFTTTTVTTSTWYYSASTFDRSGNAITRLYSSSGVEYDTVSIAAYNGLNLGNTASMVLGRYSTSTISYWTGGIVAAKFTKSLLTDKQLREDAFLPDGWTSDNGNIARYNWGWHLGIKLSSGNLLVGYATGDIVSDGAISLSLTGDSTRYNYTINEWQSGNQIIFSTAYDNLSHSLPDTTLPAGYSMQLSFDAWAETVYGETYVLIDNVSIQGVEQPEATAPATGKFKGNATHDKFKGW